MMTGAIALAVGLCWSVWAGFSNGWSAAISHRIGWALKWPVMLLLAGV
jgi:hypothetical protein